MININKNSVEMSGDIATILTEQVMGVVRVAEVISDATGKPLEESAAWVMSKVTGGVKVGINKAKND